MIFLSLFGFFQKTPVSGIEQVQDFGSNPGNLAMYQYVPEGLEKKAPLVVVLHGCTQSADSVAIESGWNKLAEENKFVVVYPQQKLSNNIKKCFNWFRKGDIQRDSGEAASIKQMVDFAVKKNQIDKKRIFIYGISAGGAMSSVMMANYPEIFNAGSLIAGIPFGATSTISEGLNAMKGNITKTGKEWADFILAQNKDYHGTFPRMLVFQGVDDPYVNKVNADEIVKQYTALHQIDRNPEILKNFDGNQDITQFKYINKNNETRVQYYMIENMGHGISIDPGEGLKQGGKTADFTIDKGFHSTYWTARYFGIVK